MIPAEYRDLYRLQDAVLELVFKEPLGFYLSGGTALSRFYLNHRYSDDLDLFTHDIAMFPDSFRMLLGEIKKHFVETGLEVDSRDFKRFTVNQGGTRLKVDCVADRLPRAGVPCKVGQVLVDTVRNILSNKLCALLDRDEARDVADVVHIAKARTFSWAEIIAEAMKKEDFQLEDLLFRLKTFPLDSLLSVPFTLKPSLDSYAASLATISQDIQSAANNSLAAPDSEGIQ